MKTIYEYADYRIFLRDFFLDARSSGRGLTYEDIGRKVGFTSKGFITQIIQGKSNLPKDKILTFGKALRLKKKELRYFELLVRFDQAKKHAEKNEIFKTLASEFTTHIEHIGPEKYELYSSWHYSTIRSLLGYYPFKGDYKELAQQLNPPITPGQAKKAIELLERLVLIEKGEDGFYHLTDRIISTGDAVGSVALTNFQQDTMELAKSALERYPKEKRDSATLTLGLSEAGYRAAVEKLAALRKDLLDIARFDYSIDRVIQFNLHAFPLTRFPGEKS